MLPPRSLFKTLVPRVAISLTPLRHHNSSWSFSASNACALSSTSLAPVQQWSRMRCQMSVASQVSGTRIGRDFAVASHTGSSLHLIMAARLSTFTGVPDSTNRLARCAFESQAAEQDLYSRLMLKMNADALKPACHGGISTSLQTFFTSFSPFARNSSSSDDDARLNRHVFESIKPLCNRLMFTDIRFAVLNWLLSYYEALQDESVHIVLTDSHDVLEVIRQAVPELANQIDSATAAGLKELEQLASAASRSADPFVLNWLLDRLLHDSPRLTTLGVSAAVAMAAKLGRWDALRSFKPYWHGFEHMQSDEHTRLADILLDLVHLCAYRHEPNLDPSLKPIRNLEFYRESVETCIRRSTIRDDHGVVRILDDRTNHWVGCSDNSLPPLQISGGLAKLQIASHPTAVAYGLCFGDRIVLRARTGPSARERVSATQVWPANGIFSLNANHSPPQLYDFEKELNLKRQAAHSDWWSGSVLAAKTAVDDPMSPAIAEIRQDVHWRLTRTRS